MNNNCKCQLQSLPNAAEKINDIDKLWQKRNKIKRIIKRRKTYIKNFLQFKDMDTVKIVKDENKIVSLKPGDKVKVKSLKEIYMTLDKWNMLKRCGFMKEMEKFCETEQIVLKMIEKFLDERDYLMKKCKGIVILKNVFCEGTIDFGRCDRTCFFFWREEWLEKIE